MVTSFGYLFQEVLKVLDQEAGIEDVDLVFGKEGVRYYVQLKSGPEGFTGPALKKTKQTFAKLKAKDRTCVTVLAFAYGSEDDLSPVWRREAVKSADKILVGKEFWEFFIGPGAYEDILSIFQEAGTEVSKELTGQTSCGLYEYFEKILRAP